MKTTRMTVGVIAIVCLALAGRLAAQPLASAADAKAEQEVLQLVQELRAAYPRADTAKIGQIMADGWELVSLAGEVWTKENSLTLLRTGKVAIESEECSDLKARVFGDTAVVTARVVGKGKCFGNEQRASYVFVRKQGRWQCIHTQGTPVNESEWLFVPQVPAAAKHRIGVYDSRALVMAFYFSDAWNATEGKRVAEAKAEMKKAKAARDKTQIADVEARFKDVIKTQVLRHKQGFSTAPVDDILSHIKDHMPEIAKAARAETIISKWDKPALAKYKPVEPVDVTMPLVYALRPTTRQLIIAAEIMTKPPIPLEQAEKMDWSKE